MSQNTPSAPENRLIRMPEVEHLVGLRRSAIYTLVNRGEFPAPLKIGAASRWSLRAVSAWMDARVKEAEAA